MSLHMCLGQLSCWLEARRSRMVPTWMNEFSTCRCSCGDHTQVMAKMHCLVFFSKLLASDLLLLHWLKPQEVRISMGMPLVADLS